MANNITMMVRERTAAFQELDPNHPMNIICLNEYKKMKNAQAVFREYCNPYHSKQS
jgi:hypothetical protein